MVRAEGAGAHYTIGELAEMAGVSTRTLRHYEDEGLLSPARDAHGYRTYTGADARRLAQIMAMRACGLPVPTIRRLFLGDGPNVRDALAAHLHALRAQSEQLRDAIGRTEAALATLERIEGMPDRKRFEALKAGAVRENEERYGREARALYGDAAVDASNERIMGLSQEEWDDKEALGATINRQLEAAMAAGDPAGEAALELARMHQRWIRLHWGFYSEEAHLGLARGYLADDRFRAYYDGAAGPGATEFLVAALEAYLK